MGDYDRFDDLQIELLNQYNSSKGKIDSWWKRGKSDSRTKLLEQFNKEFEQQLEANKRELNTRQLKENRKYISERNRDQRDLEKAQTTNAIKFINERTDYEIEMMREDMQNKKAVYRDASRYGRTPETHSSIQIIEAQTNAQIDYLMQELQIGLQAELGRMRIRIEEQRETKFLELESALRLEQVKIQGQLALQAGEYYGRIAQKNAEVAAELAALEQETEIKKDLANQVTMQQLVKLDKYNDRLAQLHLDLDNIDPNNRAEITRVKKHINALKDAINEASTRLR